MCIRDSVDLHREHLGRELGNMVARLCDAGDHDLVEDLQTSLAAALERVGDDLHRQTVVLEAVSYTHLDVYKRQRSCCFCVGWH